ncbi:hypothetical protein [Pseudomonas alloputida]|uniref:hypothetical protein n=1 Tax=Pseudomonas TaxID=286 RepID=UPI003EEB81C9
MSNETLKIEISWPASLAVGEGATINALLPTLAHDSKRLNISYAEKISIADAMANCWTITLR